MSLVSRSLWYASLPLLPTMALQGAYVAARAQRLPEAAGSRRGSVGVGQPRLNLSVIGESTAAGVGVAEQSEAITSQLARCLSELRACEVRWQVAGRNGAIMSDLHRELASALVEPLGIVVVLAGVNDTVRLTSRRRFAREVHALYGLLRARGASHVAFSAVPPMAEFPLLPRPLRNVLGLRASLLDRQLQAEIATLDHASHAPLGPLSAAENMASDGFHPNARGYTLWAALLAEHILASSS